MLNYQQIKNWFEESKQQIILVICFFLVFLIGFGTGRFDSEFQKRQIKTKINYTTKTPVVPVQNAEAGVSATATKTNDTAVKDICVVKGNISTSGRKLYHLVGGAFYKIVKPEQCFKTESEAKAAGFIKSSR